jgi:hypothetical protein
MGYHTEFTGQIVIEPPLNGPEMAYLRKFARTRRMERDGGPYFVGGSGLMGQADDPDVTNHSEPPHGQPGLWCHWVSNEDGTSLEWDGGEKFYDAEEWMRYLIDHFLSPDAEARDSQAARTADGYFRHFQFDHVLNGVIDAQGEESDDRWRLVVTDNVVETRLMVSIEGGAINLALTREEAEAVATAMDGSPAGEKARAALA